jgi:hypothetical protein
LEERMSVDMEDQSELDYGVYSEDDSSVLFHIPEEILDGAPDSGSDSGQGDYLDSDEDDGSLEPDDLASYQSSYAPSGSDSGNHGDDVPDVIIQLRKQLLKGYTLPPCPTLAPVQPTLSRAEELSLRHYLAWTESHGTVKAYNAHAQYLRRLHRRKSLAFIELES